MIIPIQSGASLPLVPLSAIPPPPSSEVACSHQHFSMLKKWNQDWLTFLDLELMTQNHPSSKSRVAISCYFRTLIPAKLKPRAMQQFPKFSNFRSNEDRLSLDRRVEPLEKKGQEGYSRR